MEKTIKAPSKLDNVKDQTLSAIFAAALGLGAGIAVLANAEPVVSTFAAIGGTVAAKSVAAGLGTFSALMASGFYAGFDPDHLKGKAIGAFAAAALVVGAVVYDQLPRGATVPVLLPTYTINQ